MTHTEAIEQMTAERYLLDELTPDLRDAFEEHYFDCPDCALDLRATAAFIEEAKAQLPSLVATESAAPARTPAVRKSRNWFAPVSNWMRPAFALPAFAMLLGVIAFQNIATIPGLRRAADEPRLVPWTSAHIGTRAAAAIPVAADPKLGAVVLIDLPPDASYTSYGFELSDPAGKQLWSQTLAAPSSDSEPGTLSLLIPGAGLQQGSYTLAVQGITSSGVRTDLGRRALDVHFNR